METFEVREASVTDAEPLALLVTQLGYPSNPPEMRERLSGLLGDPSYAAFVAHNHSALLGLGGGSLGKYFEKNGVYARLVVLVVSDGARGFGVGGALVEAVEHWALSKGARELFVNSASHREAAHRFYKRCGFQITGVRLAKSLHPLS